MKYIIQLNGIEIREILKDNLNLKSDVLDIKFYQVNGNDKLDVSSKNFEVVIESE